MEISLIRHGKSQLIDNEKIAFEEFKKWVEKYDLYGVYEEPIYPVMTLEKVSTAKLVITSNLKRSVVSAMLLGVFCKKKVQCIAMFFTECCHQRYLQFERAANELLYLNSRKGNAFFISISL